jgi:hypothetical protein
LYAQLFYLWCALLWPTTTLRVESVVSHPCGESMKRCFAVLSLLLTFGCGSVYDPFTDAITPQEVHILSETTRFAQMLHVKVTGALSDYAVPAEGEVFRIVKSNPPTEDDFRTHEERGTRSKDSPCLRCGLSTFRNRPAVEHKVRLLPVLGKFIARGTLDPTAGLTKPTGGQTHTTWWPFEGVKRVSYFCVDQG